MIRIIVNNPEQEIPEIYKDADGQVSLDIFDSTKIAITKIIDDFIEAGAIKQDNFKEIQLPISKKNRLIFGNVGNPSALNQNHGKIFDIQLLKGDDYAYPVQGLQVFDISDQNNSYSCTIFGELNDWYRPLSNLYLNELELGSSVVDYDYILFNLTDAKYTDGEEPIRPVLCNYGEWYINNNKAENSQAESQVVYNNLVRFWYYAKAILDQAFCQVGYSLVAPFMNTDTFRQTLTYILDAEFETANQLDVLNRPFEILQDGDDSFDFIFFDSPSGSEYNGVLRWGGTEIVSDPGSHIFSNFTGGGLEDFYGTFYSGGMIGNFSFNCTINFTPTSAPSIFDFVAPNYMTLTVSIRKANKFGVESQDELLATSTKLAEKTYVNKAQFGPGTNINYDFEIKTGDLKVYQHEVVFVVIELNANIVELATGIQYTESYLYPDMKVKSGAVFKNTVKQQVIEEGDTLEFGKMLMKDRTAADYFKGIAHLWNFKIETDSVGKKIYMYPEFKTDLNSDGIQEGFFLPNQENPLDATLKIQANSLLEKPKPVELGRDVYLKFADSSDGYISSLNLTDELHSKKIDLGSEYTDSENVIENPFFQPLANGIDRKLGNLTIIEGTYIDKNSINYIPFMWESGGSVDSYPEVGFDYAPRIGIYQGVKRLYIEPTQSGLDEDTGTAFIYEDIQIVAVFGVLSQIFPFDIGIDLLGVKVPIDKAVVYGNGINTEVQDLWELIYEKSVNQAYFTPSLEFLVNLSLLDFSNISFRRKWKLKYNSAAWGEIEVYARIARISDFLINGNIVTPVELLPDNNNFKDCTIQEDEFEIIFPDGNKFIEIDPAFGVNGGSPSDTDPIEIIEDKSGNGNDFEQPNATFRPKWKLDGIYGIPSIDTTGIVSYLQLLSTSLGSDEISFWIVLKREGSPNGGAYGNPLILSTNGYSSAGTNFLQINESLTANYNLNASVASLDKAITLTTNDPYILSFVKTATGMEYFVNGVSVGTNTGVQSLGGLAHFLGAWGGNSFNGLIGYLLLYNEAVSTPKRESIDALFSLKFGI